MKTTIVKLSIFITFILFATISYLQKEKTNTQSLNKDFSVSFGIHYNGYFESNKSDSCIFETVSCIDLSSMGIKRTNLLTCLYISVNYNFSDRYRSNSKTLSNFLIKK